MGLKTYRAAGQSGKERRPITIPPYTRKVGLVSQKGVYQPLSLYPLHSRPLSVVVQPVVNGSLVGVGGVLDTPGMVVIGGWVFSRGWSILKNAWNNQGGRSRTCSFRAQDGWAYRYPTLEHFTVGAGSVQAGWLVS